MTTIRRIVTSQVDGNNANANVDGEIRPFGETAFYLDTDGIADKPVLSIHDGVRTHLRSKVLGPGVLYGSNADAGDDSGLDTIKLIPDAALHFNDGNYGNDQHLIIDPTAPNHIHIRAGGTIDNSNASLFLGGENSHIQVESGENPPVYVRANSNTWTFHTHGLLQVPNTIAGTGGISIIPDNAETYAYLNLPSDANSAAYGVALANDNGKIELRTTNQGTSTSYIWKFDNDGTLTLPGSEAVLGWGGANDTNSLNIDIPDTADSNITYQFAFDASYGFPMLRFPDGTFQTTALKAETIAQVGYQLMFDTDIYANSTGGALNPYETTVLLESNAQIRALFQVEAFATSTTARAYNHPTNFGEIILEVASVTGAPIDTNTSVWAIIDGTPTPVGDIDSQQDATTWILIGAPLAAEIVLGTEFEFYASGNVSYSSTQTIILEWNDGTETEVVEGKTNNPYGLSIDLVTAEDQTTLSYPMILTTANYTPSEFSHVIDADNDFKITTRANDFIINSNEGPLVIRNASSEYLFEGGTLTVPGTINIEGVGSVVGFATGADNFIGLEGQANWGVALRATDSQLDSKNWLFGTNGVLTLPGEGVIRSIDDTIVLKSYDTQFNSSKGIRIGTNGYVYFEIGDDPAYFQVEETSGDASLIARANLNIVAAGGSSPKTWEFGTDGSLTLPDNGVVSAGGSGGLTLGGNFDVKIVADYTDNDRTWSFNGGDGSLTFPDSTVQETAWAGGRVVAVPTSSTGTAGDLQGDLAFNATYMYYCTQNFSGTVINMTSISSSGASNPYIIMYDSNTGWTSADLTGYTVTGPSGYTGTVTGPSVNIAGQLWHIPVSPNLSQSMGTYTFTSPGGDIWKRIAWSGDTW